ncbi:MAG: hypothetical protein ACRDK7_16200 [Solirubrobacteraceae bacterium]
MGEVQRHHPLHRLIPLTVSVCVSRHAAWHRLLSSLGWRGGGPATWSAVLRGFDALLWHLAAFDHEPDELRARLRRQLDRCYRVAALAEATGSGMPARYDAELAAVGQRRGDCRLKPPKTVPGRRRLEAVSLHLRAVAAICEWAPLPAGVRAVQAPRRLRAIDPARLICGPGLPAGATDELWVFAVREIAAAPTPTTVAAVLDHVITTLERL